MRHANDSRFIQAAYGIISGPYRVVIIAAVVVLAALGIYLPTREAYIAYRSKELIAQQVEIRERYKDALGKEVDSYLSEEGIKDQARKLGMVEKGEQRFTVIDGGGSEEGPASDSSESDPGSDSSADETPTTAAEVERAQAQVYENSPWYLRALDVLFLYSGNEGMASASGDASSNS